MVVTASIVVMFLVPAFFTVMTGVTFFVVVAFVTFFVMVVSFVPKIRIAVSFCSVAFRDLNASSGWF